VSKGSKEGYAYEPTIIRRVAKAVNVRTMKYCVQNILPSRNPLPYRIVIDEMESSNMATLFYST